MDYYIFRHGKTYFSKYDVNYGEHVQTAEILPEGIPPIERLGKYLKGIKTDYNVSSVFKRCRQTVAVVKKFSGKKFDYNALLHDWDPRNETIEQMAERIRAFYEELQESDNKPTSVCICTHGYPIAILKTLILKGRVNLSKLDDYPTTGAILVIKNGKPEVIDFN